MSADAEREAPSVLGESLRVRYRGRLVLDVPRINLPAGETYALLGASGAGKSTLLRVLGMLERPTSGRVTFDNEVLRAGTLSTRRRIAAVFQKPHLMRGSVEDNVAYGLRLRGVPRRERTEKVRHQLERMGIPGWEKRSALTLSGGEAQRVALARALILEPDLLLLDEPLSYLDPLLRRQLMIEFADLLANERITTLYVTHDREEALQMADLIGVMRDGRIVAEGPAAEVLALPGDEWVAAFLGAQMPVQARVIGSQRDLVHLRCCAQVEVMAQGDFSVGTECELGIRPEDITVSPADGTVARSGQNRVEAIVTSMTPSGSTVLFALDASGLPLGASVPRASARSMQLREGQAVYADFPPAAVVVRARAVHRR